MYFIISVITIAKSHVLSAEWTALCIKILEVNLSVFIYKLFHKDLFFMK